MDGVLIDSEPMHREAARRVFSDHGLPIPEAFYDDVKGRTDRDIMEEVAGAYGEGTLTAAALLAGKDQAYQALASDLQMVPGALAFLERVAGRYQLALVTSASRQNQQRAFERFGLHSTFEAVLTAEDVTTPKPDPAPYRRGAELLGLPPAQCLVLEDSVHGVTSALAAGCDVVGLPTTFPAEQLRAAGATRVVRDFDELADALHLV